MSDFTLTKRYARISRCQGELGGLGCVRVYRESPETVAFQIRARGPITGKGNESYAHVSLTADELALTIKELCARLQELEDVAAGRKA